MRCGYAHLKQMYQSQMKSRRQTAVESIQEFEVEDMARFAYKTALENIMEWLTVQTLVDRIRDQNLARPRTLMTTLATVPEFKAIKKSSRE